jgi:hypothetical protein
MYVCQLLKFRLCFLDMQKQHNPLVGVKDLLVLLDNFMERNKVSEFFLPEIS